MQATIYLYELSFLNKDFEYYDFNLWIDNKFGEVQPQTSVFKIPIDRNASLYEFHLAVYRHLMNSIRSCKPTMMTAFNRYSKLLLWIFSKRCNREVRLYRLSLFRGTKYYKIEFDFKSTKSKKWPIHQTKKPHVWEICVDETIAFEQVIIIIFNNYYTE